MLSPLLNAIFNNDSCTPSKSLTSTRARIASGAATWVLVPPTPMLWAVPEQALYADSFLLPHVLFPDPKKPTVETAYSTNVRIDGASIVLRDGRRIRILRTSLASYGPSVVVIEVDQLLVEPKDIDVSMMIAFGYINITHTTSAPPASSPTPVTDVERSQASNPGPNQKISASIDKVLASLDIEQAETPSELSERFHNAVTMAAIAAPGVNRLSVHEYFEKKSINRILNALAEFSERSEVGENWPQRGFAKFAGNLKSLDMCQVDLPVSLNDSRCESQYVEFERLVHRAVEAINLLPGATAMEMGGALLTAVEILGKPQPGVGAIVSADCLLSLLLLVVVRCSTETKALLERALWYIVHMSPEGAQPAQGPLGYALASFESVLMHIEVEHDRLATFARENEHIRDVVFNGSEQEVVQAVADTPSALRSRIAGRSILFEVVEGPRPELLEWLQQHFPDCFTPAFLKADRDLSGRTLLEAALAVHADAAVHFLLYFDPDGLATQARAPDFQGRTAAHFLYDPKYVSLADWNWLSRDSNGTTALSAVSSRYPAVLAAVIRATSSDDHISQSVGLLVNHVDRQGASLFHRAARVGFLAAIQALLSRQDADVDWANSRGATPLMWASCSPENANVILALREAGSSVWNRDNYRRAALDIAVPPLHPLLLDYSGEAVAGFKENELLVNGKIVSVEEFFQLRTDLRTAFSLSWIPELGTLSFCAIDNVTPDLWAARVDANVVRGVNLDLFLRLARAHASIGPHLLSDLQIQQPPSYDSLDQTALSFSAAAVEAMLTFYQFGIEQLETAHIGLRNWADGLEKLDRSYADFRCSQLIMLDSLRQYKLSSPVIPKPTWLELYQSSLYPSSVGVNRGSIVIAALATNTASLLNALQRPLKMVEQMRVAENLLTEERERLHKLGSSQSWLPVLETRRISGIQTTEESITQLRSQISRDQRNLIRTHDILASELASFNRFKGDEVLRNVKEHARSRTHSEHVQLIRLQGALQALRES